VGFVDGTGLTRIVARGHVRRFTKERMGQWLVFRLHVYVGQAEVGFVDNVVG
jgi:hypothetical protein